MINIESISKSFGEQGLFDNTGFQINSGEKIGLVGRNGHGKTTLLRMITGEEEPETGIIRIPGDYRLGCLSQKIDFSEDTVLDECMQGLAEHERDHYWKAEKILAGLGFSDDDMKKSPDTFSGGFQVRLTLAKVLVSEPDLLILDEPTNYLDITSIRWISNFLLSWPREILLVTHDRSFMDKVVTHISGIHRQKFRKIKGNSEKYYLQIAQDEEIYEKTRQNEDKRRREMETFITRFRAKARLAGLVQSRVKSLAKMENKEKLQNIEALEFSFRYLEFAGKQVLKARNISFSYDKKKSLINDFNLTVAPEDRIAIIGKNGKGKTTLLKLLAEKFVPDAGEVKYNPGVEKGIFEQTNISSLNERFTVEEEILYSVADIDKQQVRNICGAMMFEQDSALKKISVLSGGEKSRVMLAKILVKPANLLLLDEPTNHLDMESCDSLVAALDAFPGAVILVTHNEMFLHSLANRLIVFKNNKISLFKGTYGEFLEKEGWDDEVNEKEFSESIENPTKSGDCGKTISKKEMRKMRSEIISQRSKVLQPLQKDMNEIENKIEKREEILEQLNNDMQKVAETKDGKKIADLSCEIAQYQKRIDGLFDELEECCNVLDEKKAVFEEQLYQLETL
ncbi:MAG: ABC-F family ATP-binding cassette domain-containing protein [Thermodesulfobacteriota bacterium]|nr:ABC-F family ATP-binding cassette domain-containing protein [Thermodesulfobacteriota bacterium]